MNATFKYLAPCNMLYPEINEDVWQFFCLARSKLIPIHGPLLQSEANESTLRHNYDKFTASNGWLKYFLPNMVKVTKIQDIVHRYFCYQ